MAKFKTVRAKDFHYKWSKEHKPVMHVSPGEWVTFEVNNVTSGQVKRTSKSEDIEEMDSSKNYPLTGPVQIDSAESGDTLVVHVGKIKTVEWGFSCIVPGLGLLEEFDRPFLWKWDLRSRNFAPFKNGIKVPLGPFCGVMGVAPPGEGFTEVMPPGNYGGNLDIRHLTTGSRLRLPVWVDGGLFSVGDMHAAQGDGEVCVSAIETHGSITVKFDLEKNTKLRWPEYYTMSEKQSRRGFFATMGIAPDLMQAAKESIRNMIAYLVKAYNLTREEAYVLCSVAADLRIHEVVDKPNWVVGAMISQDVLGEHQRSIPP
jgi:acetamidase/formamidase